MKSEVNRTLVVKKTKYILLIAALAVVFASCENQTPFDTQSEDDAPLILKPYNESGTGSFTYNLANPDTPLFDSVTVTPSNYTTVNWYLDGQLIFTGLKIEMTFPAGKYALMIEAVTTQGKRTERTGTVTVHPYDTDPYSAAPAAGRHCVSGNATTLDGANLTKVDKVILSKDLYGQDVVHTIAPDAATDAQLTITLPETPDGLYYVRLMDAEGKIYGADDVNVHNASVVLAGYNEFVPGEEWTITGVKLENVASVKVDETVITELTVTATSITFTAPAAEVGEHTISMKNADGSDVYFITDAGMVTEAKTIVSAETTLWTGPVTIDWNADLVKVESATMAQVPVGAMILVYFDIPEAEYHALRVTTPWWDGYDLVSQIDGFDSQTSPFSFTYTDDCKNKVETCGAMSVVGFGVTVNKITFK